MNIRGFNDECPKCGDSPFLGKLKYCWPSLNPRCRVWTTYGGEHLHRTCYSCGYIYPCRTKDSSPDNTEQWLEDKVQALVELEPDIEPSEDIQFTDQSDDDPLEMT